MYSKTITLFNRYHRKSGGDMWYPHLLTGVDLNADKASILATYGSDSTDSAELHVKYSKNENGNIVIGNEPWFPPKEWKAQTNDLLPESITFSADATYFDFFVLGEYRADEPIADNDYSDGFYEYVRTQKDYCYTITSVSTPYILIPFFKIMAK
jgi:hypothetical protein